MIAFSEIILEDFETSGNEYENELQSDRKTEVNIAGVSPGHQMSFMTTYLVQARCQGVQIPPPPPSQGRDFLNLMGILHSFNVDPFPIKTKSEASTSFRC